MDEATTYNVRVYKTRVYKGTKVTTYTVRWRVGTDERTEPYRNSAQADSFRSSLLVAARNGEAFSIATGRPVAWQRAEDHDENDDKGWYEFACAYADMKWKAASAKYRKDIARALTAATPALLADTNSLRPAAAGIRKALMRWGFNAKQRPGAPAEVAAILAWVERNSLRVSALQEPAMVRRMLNIATTRVDGRPYGASTARRHRVILANAMDYAIELRILSGANPVRSLKWKPPKISGTVDRRCVVNPRQARALLAAVGAQQPSGPRLVAFFGLLYYAGLRPEEAINLYRDNITLPSLVPNAQTGEWEEPPDDDNWGELHLRNAAPDAGAAWTDDGNDREVRPLKHRAEDDSRTVPVCPQLTRLFRVHLREFTTTNGRLFTGVRGAEMLPEITYRRAWAMARRAALTAEQQASPLGKAPTTCDMRACLPGSTAAFPPRKSPSGPATAWTCCCGSTPSASTANTSWRKRRITEALHEMDERPSSS